MARTLIVDDMPEVYDKVRGHFDNPGYAQTLNKALEKINSGGYGRVLTDYHLGEEAPQGGLEVIRAARKRGLSVLLMSRENQEEEAEKLGIRFKFKREIMKNGWD